MMTHTLKLLAVMAVVITCATGIGQVTNAPLTNEVVEQPREQRRERAVTKENIPTTKEDFWKLGIAAVTPVFLWGVAHLHRIPKPLLPAVTPVVGILLGLGLKTLSNANLSWMDMGQAGALGVFIREIVNQWVTKQLHSPPKDTEPE